MAVTTFGFGTPINPPSFIPWGSSPFGLQGLSVNPYLAQQAYGQPLQAFPLLHPIPQQLQQLQQMVAAQYQQLQQIQQLLQVIPAQLVQLQQLIQLVPQQILQLSSAQLPGLTGFGATAPWGITPQMFGQPGHVM